MLSPSGSVALEGDWRILVRTSVTDLPGPPSARTANKKLKDLKKCTQRYTRDRTSCDDLQISYLETLEDCDNDNLRLAQMLAG
jgi:hypothetical protein